MYCNLIFFLAEQGVNAGAFTSNKTSKMLKMFRTILKIPRNTATEKQTNQVQSQISVGPSLSFGESKENTKCRDQREQLQSRTAKTRDINSFQGIGMAIKSNLNRRSAEF